MTINFLSVMIINVRKAQCLKSQIKKSKENFTLTLDKKDLSNKIINAVRNGFQIKGFLSLKLKVLEAFLRLPRLGL